MCIHLEYYTKQSNGVVGNTFITAIKFNSTFWNDKNNLLYIKIYL